MSLLGGMKKEVSSFALIGSGRVASQIAPALCVGGMRCQGVYSPTLAHAEALSKRLGCPAISGLEELIKLSVDVTIVAVKDDVISDVVAQFPSDYPATVLHTSGGTPIEVLAAVPHYGVLYPMQTFSPERALVASEIPIFYESSDEESEDTILAITKALGSRTALYLNSSDRAKLHIASVFACNFVNHLYAEADEIMHSIGLDFSVLLPLVRETLDKASEFPPHMVQTGPAIREDHKTIERHLSCLQGSSKELYEVLTKAIISKKKVRDL